MRTYICKRTVKLLQNFGYETPNDGATLKNYAFFFFRFFHEQETVLFSETSRPAMWPTNPLIQ
jgi:hypothetical protein